MQVKGMATVQVYVTERCGYCIRAKALLDKRGIPYEVIDVSHDEERRAWLVKASGLRTVPQIFILGESVGGYDELYELDRSGELQKKLAPAP